jgi:hypothetical protein
VQKVKGAFTQFMTNATKTSNPRAGCKSPNLNADIANSRSEGVVVNQKGDDRDLDTMLPKRWHHFKERCLCTAAMQTVDRVQDLCRHV